MEEDRQTVTEQGTETDIGTIAKDKRSVAVAFVMAALEIVEDFVVMETAMCLDTEVAGTMDTETNLLVTER
jgi:hypothetical protein